MTRHQLIERLEMSRRTLFNWRFRLPEGSEDDTLQLIAKEIAMLKEMSARYPDRSAAIDALAVSWRELALQVLTGEMHRVKEPA